MAELGIFDGSKMKPSKYAYVRPGWHKFKIVAVDSADTASDWNQPNGVVLTIDVECVSGPDKGNMQQIKIWENATFILGSIMVAAGIKLPAGNFRLKQEHLLGKGFYALCDDRPDKKDTSKVYTNFSRFEPLSFVPPAAAAPAAPAAETPKKPAGKPATAPAAVEDDGIEEITEDDLG